MSKYHRAFQGFVKVFTGAAKKGDKNNPTTIIGVSPSKRGKDFKKQKDKIIKTVDKYSKGVSKDTKLKMRSGTSKTLGKISDILSGKKTLKRNEESKKMFKKAEGKK